jgi:hypothetical protein
VTRYTAKPFEKHEYNDLWSEGVQWAQRLDTVADNVHCILSEFFLNLAIVQRWAPTMALSDPDRNFYSSWVAPFTPAVSSWVMLSPHHVLITEVKPKISNKKWTFAEVVSKVREASLAISWVAFHTWNTLKILNIFGMSLPCYTVPMSSSEAAIRRQTRILLHINLIVFDPAFLGGVYGVTFFQFF